MTNLDSFSSLSCSLCVKHVRQDVQLPTHRGHLLPVRRRIHQWLHQHPGVRPFSPPKHYVCRAASHFSLSNCSMSIWKKGRHNRSSDRKTNISYIQQWHFILLCVFVCLVNICMHCGKPFEDTMGLSNYEEIHGCKFKFYHRRKPWKH